LRSAAATPGRRRIPWEYVRTRSSAVRIGRRLEQLTDREREVAALVGSGLSNEEIAERVFVSVATAKTHVSRVMTKRRARDRAQLVVMAYEAGLVRPGWSA
jgi:DNA-binding NarL/FixJ family response regulator